MEKIKPKNLEFQRAITCLSHPLSLIALGVLLLNDHLFRIIWPGWWTGKLGDFAWLFFFPFALIASLTLLIPEKLKHLKQPVAYLGFGMTGGIFTLAKTWSLFNNTLNQITSHLFGWQVNWSLDLTDLVALLSLIGAVGLWQRSAHWQLNHRKPAWLLLALVASLTMANSIGSSQGIYCLTTQDGQLYALSVTEAYVSESGGLIWKTSEQRWMPCESHFYEDSVTSTTSLKEPIILSDPDNPAGFFRISTGKVIEYSIDGGHAWTIEYQPEPLPQAIQAHIAKNRAGSSDFKAPPLDAAFDPQSGNLIFAMGFDGVLVREQDGSYTQVGVGAYRPETPSFTQLLLTLFPGEAIMTLIFGSLGAMVLASRQRLPLLHRLISYATGLLWMIVAVWFPPAFSYSDYLAGAFILALMAMGVTLFPYVLHMFIKVSSVSPPLFTRMLLAFIGSGMIFLLALIAWITNILPDYRLAQILGFLLGCGWIYEQFRRSKKMEENLKEELS